MNNKTTIKLLVFMAIMLAFVPACQKISVPEDAQVKEVYLNSDLTARVGEFVTFFGEIEIPYQVRCTSQINDDDACPLRLKDSPHIINVIMGLNKNNVTSSGRIIFSNGESGETDLFGGIAAQITGLVKECDEKKACRIDVYQLDKPKS